MTTIEAHFAAAAGFRRYMQTPAAAQNVHGFSKLFARRVVAVDEQQAEVAVEFTVPAEYATFTGSLHGGATATMLDEVSSMAIFARVGLHCFKGTATLSIQYLRPVLPGTVVCRARVLREGKEIIFVECGAYDAKGRLLAKSAATAALDFARPVLEFTPSGRRFAYLEAAAAPPDA